MDLREILSEFSSWQKGVVILLTAGILGGASHFARVLSEPPELARYRSIPWVSYVHPNVKKLQQAQKLAGEGKLREAQAILTEALIVEPTSPVTTELRDLLGNLNTRIFFSKEPSPRKTEYTVKQGDSLAAIARKLGSSVEAIMRVNGLDSTLIRPGQKLFVPRLDFAVTVDLPSNRVIIHDAQGFFAQYPIVSVTLPGSKSPVLKTTVTAKSSGEKNGFSSEEKLHSKAEALRIDLRRAGYALYGLRENKVASASAMGIAEPSTASGDGASVSPGGIGMLRDDLAELQLLVRKGTPVTIIRNR
jgi:LysM repeat protein